MDLGGSGGVVARGERIDLMVSLCAWVGRVYFGLALMSWLCWVFGGCCRGYGLVVGCVVDFA
jgi:hypothetical protein